MKVFQKWPFRRKIIGENTFLAKKVPEIYESQVELPTNSLKVVIDVEGLPVKIF